MAPVCVVSRTRPKQTPALAARSAPRAIACIIATGPKHEHKSGRATLRKLRLRGDIDLTAIDHAQIEGEAGNAVSVDAAQIGPDQSVGHDRGVLGTRAFAFECIANEAG